jgi:hypothetical protein
MKVDPGFRLHSAIHRKFTDPDSPMGELAGLNILEKDKRKTANRRAANQLIQQQKAASGTMLDSGDKLGG